MLNLSSLNPQQRMAVETSRGPVLILAGAGTGKTRVITFRIALMVQKGISPGHILGVTFTNKAAREMQERVRDLLPKPSRNRPEERGSTGSSAADVRPTICTFHSLCVRILRQHIEKLGYKRNFVIYDESEQLGAVKKVLSRISAKGEKTEPGPILSMLSRLKNGGSRSPNFGDPSVIAMAAHIRDGYESALRACNAVDFDDLILLTLRLFAEHPDALAACRDKYHYVMVDEYQDTNESQFQLVKALTSEHRNLCVVGDDDQSIYGWRGAEIANLLDMEKHYPEVKVVKLEQNYRSTSTILKAANAIIKNNVRRRGKQLWSQKGDGPRILLHSFSDDESEGKGVVERIEYLRIAERIPWSDQAILFRTNIQSRPLETALRQGGVRYHLIGGQSFFDRREIRDFLAYLKTIINPNDDVNLLRIANVPARGLSDQTMERLLGLSHERHCSVFAVMKNPVVTATFQARTRTCIEDFVSLIERTRGALFAGSAAAPATHSSSETVPLPTNASAPAPRPAGVLAAWADRCFDEIGYYAELRRSEKNVESADQRIRNLKELIASLDPNGASSKSAFDRLESFLEEITLDNEREEEDEAPGNAVTLITMHSCKGLEYPHVYVVGLEEGLLPHSRSKVEGTLDEERRLFYVAVTRAMQTLHLSHCASRKKYGQAQACHPSQFLQEIPPELVEDADEKGKQVVAPDSGASRFAAMRAGLD